MNSIGLKKFCEGKLCDPQLEDAFVDMGACAEDHIRNGVEKQRYLNGLIAVLNQAYVLGLRDRTNDL